MNISPGFADDLPDLPHVRQLKAGFHWLNFDPELEKEFRRSRLDETIGHVRGESGSRDRDRDRVLRDGGVGARAEH